MSKVYKVLSIRQPWAWLILHARKDVENRTWATKFKGRFLIHAGAGMTPHEYQIGIDFMAKISCRATLPDYDVLRQQCGGVVGSAEIVRCVARYDSPWFVGPLGFVLSDPKPMDFIPLKGRLGFFEVEL